MRVEKTFQLGHPIAVVWREMCSVQGVAACLPGAEVTDDLGDGRYAGLFSVKLGPLAATFKGEIALSHDDDAHAASVSGKGADARSGSRASGTMSYQLAAADNGTATRVDVVSDITLAGSLAQFGKGAVMQEVANRITAQFIENFEKRLAEIDTDDAAQRALPAAGPADTGASGAPSSAAPRPSNASLNLGALAWSILRDRCRALFAKIFQKERSS